jgi:hypothetical protein
MKIVCQAGQSAPERGVTKMYGAEETTEVSSTSKLITI